MRLKKSGELTQVSEVAVSNKGTTVAFTSDVISEQQGVTEITDDFIANL